MSEHLNNSEIISKINSLDENTSGSIKENTKKILIDAKNIKEKFKNCPSELQNKVNKGYKDVRNKIIESIKKDQDITQLELELIRVELNDLTELERKRQQDYICKKIEEKKQQNLTEKKSDKEEFTNNIQEKREKVSLTEQHIETKQTSTEKTTRKVEDTKKEEKKWVWNWIKSAPWKAIDWAKNAAKATINGAASIWSIVINVKNKFSSEQVILKDLEFFLEEVNDPFLQWYMKKEIQALKDGKQKDSWTTLMHTYTKNQEYDFSERRIRAKLHNSAQESIIKSFLWDEKGYNNQYIQGYNNQISNYLISIKDFKEKLRWNSDIGLEDNKKYDPKNLNSLEVWNYLLYLDNKGANMHDIIKEFWPKKFSQLVDIWKHNDETIVKRKLEKSWKGEIITKILKFAEQIEGEDFFDIYANANNEQKEALSAFLKENIDWIQENFRTKIQEKYKDHKQKEEITNDLMIILSSNWNIDSNLIVSLQAIEKKYNIKINQWEFIQNQSTKNKTTGQLEYIKAIKSGDTKKAEKLKKKVLKDMEIEKFLKNSTSTELDNIVYRIWNGESITNIIQTDNKEKKEENNLNENIISTTERKTSSQLQESDFTKTSTGDYNVVSLIDNKRINVTEDEREIMLKWLEPCKNFMEFEKVTRSEWLSFLRKHRVEMCNIMKSVKWTSGVEDKDNNFIDKSEFTRLLNFTLELTWESNKNLTYEQAIEKIRTINQIGVINNKKDTITWLSTIWNILYKKWYINLGDKLSTENIANLQNRKNWNKKIEQA